MSSKPAKNPADGKTDEQLIAEGWRDWYGRLIPPLVNERNGQFIRDQKGKTIPTPGWMVELEIVRGSIIPRGYRGRFWHFKQFVSAIWGDPSDKSGYFQWNPNAEKILQLLIEPPSNKLYCAAAGCASSGKTQVLALYAVAAYLLNPLETKVLVTSQTIATAESKVWGHMLAYWDRAQRELGKWMVNMPGKVIASKHIIAGMNQHSKTTRLIGIELVPAEASEFKESAQKLQGYKCKNVIVCGDEWATLAPAILETCKTNLSNNENFQLIGAFNPDSHFDPGGMLAEPEDGWSSIDLDSEKWKTKLGWCLRFDGLKSPNVLAGRREYLGLLSIEELAAHREAAGGNETSRGFMKMVRGFWSAAGSAEAILTEAELLTHNVGRRHEKWLEPGTMIAGLDPSFTHGGDKAVLTIGRVGKVFDHLYATNKIVVERVKTYVLDDDIAKSKDKNEQIVDRVAELLKEHGVATEDLGVDITGAAAFGTLLAQKIGTGFVAINFGGAPTSMPVSKTDKRTGKDAYVNRASELWFGLKPLIRSGQIAGLDDPDTLLELCARTYTNRGGRVEIESKDKMKLRTKKSPDKGDSFCIMVDVARLRHGLTATERPPPKPKTSEVAKDIFGQTFDLEALKPKKSGHKIMSPLLQEESLYMGMGGWEN